MSKLDRIRQKRLESKSQSDNVNDTVNSAELETVTPEIIEDSIEADNTVKSQLVALLSDFEKFSKNKEILAKLAPDKLKELEDLEDKVKNTLNFVKIENKVKNNLIIHPFTDNNLTPKSSSFVDDAFFFLCTSKKLPIDKITDDSFKATKSFKDGKANIYLIFQEVKESIENELGIDTFRVFSVFMIYWYLNKENIVDGNLRISSEDIFNLLDRQDKFYYDENKKKKRYSKLDNLKWLEAQIELLSNVKVYSSTIVIRKGKEFSIPKKTPLIDFEETTYDYELIYTFKIKWVNFFDDKNYYKHFGYLHKEALSSEGIKSGLLLWLQFKLEQHQTGDFTVRTILQEVFEDKLEAILKESNSKIKSTLTKNLYRDFHRYLNEIKHNIEDPYQWEYKDPPEWVLDENLIKPRGKWWDIWLNVIIVFKHPECLIPEGKAYRREKIKEVTPEPKSEKIKTTEDLKYVMDKFKISIRDLVKKSENKFTYYKLQKSLNKENGFKESEIRELITYCYQINQSRKK